MQGIHLIFVGKTDEAPVMQLINRYLKRLSRFIPIQITELPDIKKTKNLSQELQKKKETEQILPLLSNQDTIILLDEKGQEYSSREFSSFLDKKLQTTAKRLVFIIGGPYGFSDDLKSTHRNHISLSRMTFSHQMVRIFLIEQIYRAFSIRCNLPYHHD